MAAETYKLLIFLKRRPGMSVADFRCYYEDHHAKLCEQFTFCADRYVRRFLDPLPNPETGEDGELPFDVITEIWLKDKGFYDNVVKMMSTGRPPEIVIEDEMKLFDRSRIRAACVIECDSDPVIIGKPLPSRP